MIPDTRDAGWQKFVCTKQTDLLVYAVVSFFGVMGVVGSIATGLFLIRCLY